MKKTFSEFLKRITSDDKIFLGIDELHKIPESSCALANSSGGWIIAGAVREFDDAIIITGTGENFDAGENILPGIFYDVENFGEVTAIKIHALEWHKKPIIFHGQVWRRVECENIISGAWARGIFSADALNFSRDDFPVSAKIFDDDVKNFCEFVKVSRENLLGVFSGKHLTFAGALMFGECVKVRAVLENSSRRVKLEACNLWRAYREILPRLTQKLSPSCANAVREIFVNAILHADYNISRKINITITDSPARIIITNPGTIRGTTRNYRLAKIFRLAKISGGVGGIKIIREYSPSFKLQQDMLNFRVIASLKLEGLPAPILL